MNPALGRALEHFQRRRLLDAEECCREAIEADRTDASAWYLLGAVLHTLGQHDESIDACRRAIDLGAELAELYLCLGTSLWLTGRGAEAIPVLEDAVDKKPSLLAGHLTLASALRDQARFEEAATSFRKCLEIDLNLTDGHQGLGLALKNLGRFPEAIQSFRWALRQPGDHHGTHTHLGSCLEALDRPGEAVEQFRAALALKDDAVTHVNLSRSLGSLGQLGEAVEHLRAALDLDPDLAVAHHELGTALQGQGLLESAADCYRTALELDPTRSRSLSSFLFVQHFMEGATEAELARAHAEWEERFGSPLVASWQTTAGRAADLAKPPRLGFVSPDLWRHPVGWLLVRVLEGLRGKTETFVYSDRVRKDDLTARLQASATAWRDVCGLTDEKLARRIREDGIDVLVDLAGHTSGGRLLTFARRPAPVQVTWLGYEGTTGLGAMDGLIADRHVVPPGSESHYMEKILRMPESYVCYSPPEEAPDVGPLPCLERGHVTFGNSSDPAGITPRVVATWAEILRGVPGSRMILDSRGLDDPATRRRFERLFAAEGITQDRLELAGRRSNATALAAHREIDLGLDTFPFSGNVTTLEALWMGVPVVTFPGASFASRHGVSHLAAIGLTGPIAGNREQYVQRAIALAGDRSWLASCREHLRERMRLSPLCDGERFATDLLGLLRDL